MLFIRRKSCVMEETVVWTQDATVISAQPFQYQHVKYKLWALTEHSSEKAFKNT